MKQILKLLSFLWVTISFCFAQTSKQPATTTASEPASTKNAKSDYIQQQRYLSKNSTTGMASMPNDSLEGFDEEAMKPILLKNGVYGAEYQNYMALQKRSFIKQKYNLVPPLPSTPVTAPSNGGKPIGGGGAFVNGLPCVNEDFEATPPSPLPLANPGPYNGLATAITGWTVESGMNSSVVYTPNPSYGAACNANALPGWNAGSPELWVVQTPLFNVTGIGTLPHSPLGGINVLKMQDQFPTGLMTRLKSTFPVTVNNTLFQFAYAGSWDGVHECCGQPAFRIDMYQQSCTSSSSTLMACSNVSLTPSGPQCSSGVPGYTMTGTVSWTNWVVRYIDLTPYIGQCVTIVITNADCSYTGHHGSAYFDAMCGGQLIGTGLTGVGGNIPGPVSFCAGSNQAIITAPLGYSTYSWVAPNSVPPVAPAQATLPAITITNPIPNTVYTVYLTGQSGCQFISTNTIVFSQVNIAGIGAGTTCAGGASGTATVQGNGSGTGYNYTWINALNSATVGTTQMVAGLAAGVYSVVLTGLGAQGCGSAVATTTVNIGTPAIVNIFKPFCGTQAYLSMPGGSQYQWYNPSLQPIPSNQGGTVGSYTVNNPVSQQVYWLSYMSQYGCKDSVKFTLGSAPPGTLAMKNISLICPGGNNGTAVVSLTPALGAPAGANSFTVSHLGQTPVYNSSVAMTSATNFPLAGLSGGQYTVTAFDGSCKYNLGFTVNSFTFDYSTSPVNNPTLCPGNTVAGNLVITSQYQPTTYTYSWTPNLFIGNSASYPNVVISPTLAPGTQTVITYTTVVTPAIVNCPLAKTIQVTAVNPATPTITAIPQLCNTSNSHQIQVIPTGGVFVTGISGPNNPITSTGLLIPNLVSANTVQTFTYINNVSICSAASTASFQVSTFVSAALTSTVPDLCVTNNQFNLMNIVQNQGGQWSVEAPGPGNGVNFNSLIPSNFNIPSSATTTPYSLKYKTTSIPIANTCPDSATTVVQITKLVTPTITALAPFCTNAPTKTLQVDPSGGTWYNHSAVTSAGLVTPGLIQPNQIPFSTAFYSIAIGPCVNIAQTLLEVSRFNPATIQGIPPQCEKSGTLNLMPYAVDPSGVWSQVGTQPGTFTISNTGIVNFTGKPTGTYTLNYHVPSTPNAALCPDDKQVVLDLLNPVKPQISNIGPLCNNQGAVQLTVTPSTGKWVPTAYVSASGEFTPSLASIGSNAVQYIVGNAACNRSETKMIDIEAFVSAEIMNKLGDQCSNGTPVSLQPLTANPGNWSGPGITGITFNPGLTGSGTFTLVHKTASSPSGLCPDEDMMAVKVFSLATPEIVPQPTLCNNALPVQLQVTPVGGLFGGASMGVVSLEGKFNPGSAMIGDNIVNYTITSGPCVAYAQTTVVVDKFVSADFAKYIEPFCLTPNIQPVNLNSYVQNPGGKWDGPGVTGHMFDPKAANIGTNNKLVYFVTSELGWCQDSSSVRVEVRNAPVVSAASNTMESCAPGEFHFNTPSYGPGDGGTGTWYFDDGSAPVKGLEAKHVYATPGKYNVTFAYVDDIGCEAVPTKIENITVHEIPRADFSIPEEVLISSPEVQLTNLSTVISNNTYQWMVTGQILPYTEVHPLIKFPKVGKYQITLVATTAGKGCKDEITKMVEVKNDFNIYIPTSFSPNFDGLNDIFIPVFSEYGLDHKSFEMEVFDRWGHLLFHSTDVTKGWNGTIQNKGEPLKEEVYVYRIKYKDNDGNSYNKMGHVTLLK